MDMDGFPAFLAEKEEPIWPNSQDCWHTVDLFQKFEISISYSVRLSSRFRISPSTTPWISSVDRVERRASPTTIRIWCIPFLAFCIVNFLRLTLRYLLGHSSVETTMIYTHVMRGLGSTTVSPLDQLGTKKRNAER